MEMFIANKPAPDWVRDGFEGAGTCGVLRLSDQLILLKIDDFSPPDLRRLRGPTEVRVYRGRTVLLLNLVMRGLSFDLWWSPVIGRLTGEPPLDADWEGHPVLAIVAMDRRFRVRNVRSATVSPEVGVAIARGMQELLDTPCEQKEVLMEVRALTALHGARFPEGLFHAACRLGD